MRILVTKLYPSDGGTIYLQKLKKHGGFSGYIELVELSLVFMLYEKFISARIGRVIARLPFFLIFEWFVTIIIGLEVFLSGRLKEIHGTAAIVSENLIFMRLVYWFTATELHYISLDIPWTYKNSLVNKRLLMAEFSLYKKRIKSCECCTNEMRDGLGLHLTADKVFVTYSSLDLITSSKAFFGSGDSRRMRIRTDNEELSLMFAGNLRFRAELVEALEIIYQAGSRFILHLYSSSRLTKPGVVNHGFVDQKVLDEAAESVDFGIVTLGTSSSDKLVSSTSFPSKTFQYLRCGLPLLVIAPQDSALVGVVNKYNLGLVLTKASSKLEFDEESFVSGVERLDCYLRSEWERYFKFISTHTA